MSNPYPSYPTALPTPGGDSGSWGHLLNNFLSVSIYNNINDIADPNNGTLNTGVVGALQLANRAVGATQADLPSLAGGMLLSGALASRPVAASTNAGLYYLATDANGGTLYQSDGSTWHQAAAGVNQSPTGTAGGDLANTYPNPTVVATHLSSPLPIVQGGTGSATQNFVDLSTNQTVAGNKAFSGTVSTGALRVTGGTPGSGKVLTSDSSGNATWQGPDVALSAYGQQQLATQRSQALIPWIAALSNRHYARCNVVCIGDSIAEGQGATQVDRRWVARLRDNLRNRFQTTGLTGGGRGFLGVVATGESSFAWPTTIAGTPGSGNTLGPKSKFLQLNASGQSVTYSLTGDAADIMWTQVGFGGTFSYSVDGGATTNVSTNGGSTVDGKITHISLGTVGAHTLTLAWVSGNVDIDGVVEYNGDYSSGIQVHDAGHYGWSSASWVTATAGGSNGPANAINTLNPGAIIITLGANDQFANVPPATFQTNLTTLISQLRAVESTPYPSIVLNMLPPRGGQSGYTYPWSDYVNAAWSVATADTGSPNSNSLVTVLDFTLGPRLLGGDSNIYGAWNSTDQVHPTDKGHNFIADYLAAFLSPN